MLLAEERTHTLIYEWGGPAVHSGLVMHGVVAAAGRVTPEQVHATEDLGPGGIVVLENTHRSSGARIWPLDEFAATASAARERGAAVHLDGARLFNAAVAAGIAPSEWGRLADSVTVCFSKGLGCPLGAVLAGSAELIERAWEGKFLFGGALRQAGVVAAAMLYALDHHVERLADDHVRAKRLADGLAEAGVPVDLEAVETNFVGIALAPLGLEEPAALARLRDRGVLLGHLRPGLLRAALHLDIGDDDVERAIEVVPQALGVAVRVGA
jgi:threonine aldolase